MKKTLTILLLLLFSLISLPAFGATEYEYLHLDREDIENKLIGNTVTFRMMDSDKTAKKLDIDDTAIKYMSDKGIKLIIETTNMTLTATSAAFKTAEWTNAVKLGEPMGVRLLIKKGDATKVSDYFDEWYYNQIGLSRYGTVAWDIAGEILVGGSKEYDIVNFAVPISIKAKYPLSETGSENNLEMHVLNEQTEKWDYVGGTVDLEKRTISFNTKVSGLFIILSNNKPQQFTDIKGHWAETDIQNMLKKNVVQVTGDKKFYPNREITRAEFATFLARTLDLESSTSVKKFQDVGSEKPYYNEVMAAAQSGIIVGVSKDKFSPDTKITRQEIAVMLTRASRYRGNELTVNRNILARFTDRERIALWAKDSCAQVISAGMMSGRSNSMFEPESSTTRAEAVVLLCRLLDKLVK